MEQAKISNLYELNETIAAELFDLAEYPWEVLPKIKDYILALGEKLDPEIFEKRGEDIWIAKSARIAPTASLNGPLIIDEEAEIRHCAFIRGSVVVGKKCVVGNSTELKNVILFNCVQVPHYNYVGDSILGYKSHMGAGSITSNVKSDKTLVVVKEYEASAPKGNVGQLSEAGEAMKEATKSGIKEEIATGLKKVGAMLGDYVEVGCNSVLNPGTVIGRNTSIYPTSCVRGVIPEDSVYKKCGDIVKKE